MTDIHHILGGCLQKSNAGLDGSGGRPDAACAGTENFISHSDTTMAWSDLGRKKLTGFHRYRIFAILPVYKNFYPRLDRDQKPCYSNCISTDNTVSLMADKTEVER
jgi:hypothetical protein